MTKIMSSFKKLFVVFLAANILAVSGSFLLVADAACEGFDKSILGIPTWYKYLEGEDVSGKCTPVVNAVDDVLPIGLAVLEAALTLGGIVAVVMVFVGGFKYVISQGEPDKAAGGRKTVTNALIGLAIIILATRVVSFIGNRLG
jgi:hypothetical protein